MLLFFCQMACNNHWLSLIILIMQKWIFSRKSYSRSYQGKVKYRRSSLGMIYTHDVHKNSPIFKTATHFVHLRPRLFHLLDFRRPISNEISSLQMITNQLKENIIQWWLLHVIRPFVQVGFCFQHQLINLAWLSIDLLSFTWSLTICFFVVL